MQPHPAANSFPMMDAKRFAELVGDIRANGLQCPITICEGMVLDGRNRYAACDELGIEPSTQEFVGDPWAYVWSLNGQRRDLSDDQRAQIWIFVNAQSERWREERARIAAEANRKRAEAAKEQHAVSRPWAGEEMSEMVVVQSVQAPSESERAPSRAAQATAAGVNAGSIARAEALEAARPDLAEKVRTGEMKPAEARRQAKKDAVSEKVSALPDDKYVVVYADPPWAYNDKQGGEISESYGAAEKHYPSMTLAELSVLGVREISAEDSVLFLWATSPLLPDALTLVKAWGFTYKASFVWDKVKHNMGHYNSVRHEFLLICTRGSCTPQNSKLYDSVQSIERTKHSEKPEFFREIIETLYPQGKRIELFARKRVDGWCSWGNEA